MGIGFHLITLFHSGFFTCSLDIQNLNQQNIGSKSSEKLLDFVINFLYIHNCYTCTKRHFFFSRSFYLFLTPDVYDERPDEKAWAQLGLAAKIALDSSLEQFRRVNLFSFLLCTISKLARFGFLMDDIYGWKSRSVLGSILQRRDACIGVLFSLGGIGLDLVTLAHRVEEIPLGRACLLVIRKVAIVQHAALVSLEDPRALLVGRNIRLYLAIATYHTPDVQHFILCCIETIKYNVYKIHIITSYQNLIAVPF